MDEQRSLVGRIKSLVPRCRQALAPSGWGEDFLLVALDLVRFYPHIRAQAARIPAIRESTRQELFRRLLIDREYMHFQSAGPVSLAAASRAACLSPFHFHRGFTQAFERTPYAYLTGIRLARARAMLECGSLVIDVCLDAGFATPSAFTRLFQSQFGEKPSEVRRKFARLGKRSSEDSVISNA
jgi:AraC family transcriptional regulator